MLYNHSGNFIAILRMWCIGTSFWEKQEVSWEKQHWSLNRMCLRTSLVLGEPFQRALWSLFAEQVHSYAYNTTALGVSLKRQNLRDYKPLVLQIWLPCIFSSGGLSSSSNNNNIWWSTQVLKLLTVQSSPVSVSSSHFCLHILLKRVFDQFPKRHMNIFRRFQCKSKEKNIFSNKQRNEQEWAFTWNC